MMRFICITTEMMQTLVATNLDMECRFSSSGQSIEAELVEPKKFRARYRIPLNNLGNIGILPYRDGWSDKDGPDRLLNNSKNKAQGQRVYLIRVKLT